MNGEHEDRGFTDSQGTGRVVHPRGSSTPGAVGPSDVADEVKEVLRAAFDVPVEELAPARRSEEPPRRSEAAPALDETAPIDPLSDDEFSEPEPPIRKRRRFRDIARDYDTRQKAKSSSQQRTESTAPAPEIKTVSGKKRVVITDDEVLKISTSAPKEERKRKKKRLRPSDEVTRLPNRRWWHRTADGRWRLRWYSIVGIVLVALVLVLLILTSPLLSIRSIQVEGNVYTNQAQLDEILAQIDGDAILTADLHGATRRLEAIPWVRRARVSMHLPSRVVVQIDERVPEAFFRASDGYIRVIDREGRVLDVIEGDPVDYTRIIGEGPSLAPGDFVQQPFLGAVELLGALPAGLSDRLVSATVSPEGEISLQFSPNLLIIFGQPADFQVKLVAVVNEMKRQGSRSYTVIDVSTGEPNVR